MTSIGVIWGCPTCLIATHLSHLIHLIHISEPETYIDSEGAARQVKFICNNIQSLEIILNSLECAVGGKYVYSGGVPANSANWKAAFLASMHANTKGSKYWGCQGALPRANNIGVDDSGNSAGNDEHSKHFIYGDKSVLQFRNVIYYTASTLN